MPGIASAASEVATTAHGNDDPHFSDGMTSRNSRLSSINGFWSNHREELTYDQLQKFWSELSHQARQKLLRIDKQTLFEQARKNMYCSRCHGLLLEGYMQIIIYGKSLQQEALCNHNTCNRVGGLKKQNDSDMCATGGLPDEIQDPSVHPWGGLTTTRHGMLTVLDCYLHTSSLKGLQNVFDNARARERERELLYPDACGGDGRGWVSHEMGGYGRVQGSRESCALHNARLSVETLVEFWSALGEETRQSLLRMKEEDFIERLMYRFDSKKFCRDCRRNVIREFKELKELKRIRRENRCTSWFCVADAAFQYQVSHDMIQVDWHQTFGDFGAYHHFEWAVGTGEGKSDVLEFENVGLNGRVQVKGLDLRAINSCYVTLRGWKLDGRCTELSVKAHALKGQQCVHCRLVVGDGFVSITRGESIKRFFEHAEEAEEDEDDESMDKDGNELDGEYSRPQKHAKSPELAREFLLDAATVIFKEQVEKAFREGTARQNAHSIFLSLSLKMLEERVHVACKEIITLEKQMKLLEEEEKEKREEEERKERKRTKEREKKLRRKERLREKEKDRGKRCSMSNQDGVLPSGTEEAMSVNTGNNSNPVDKGDAASETEEPVAIMSLSSDIQDKQLLDEFFLSGAEINSDCPDQDLAIAHDESCPSPIDHFNYPTQKFRKEWSTRRRFTVASNNRNMVCKYEPKRQVNHFDSSRSSTGLVKQLKNNRSSLRNGGSKFGERFSSDPYESHSCSCKPINDNKANVEPQMSRLVRESKPNRKLEMAGDVSRQYYRHSQAEYADKCGTCGSSNRDSSFSKEVWEPFESQKRHPQNNIDYGSSLKSSTLKGKATESDLCSESCNASSCLEGKENSVQTCQGNKDVRDASSADFETEEKMENGFVPTEKPLQYKETREDHPASDLLTSSSSNSENCSSCFSEGDSITFSSNAQSTESSSSESEDASQNSEGREPSACPQNGFPAYRDGIEKKYSTGGKEHVKRYFTTNVACTNSRENSPSKGHVNIENKVTHASIGIQPQSLLPKPNQNIRIPVFQSPLGYYHPGPVAWPTSPANGFIPVPHSNQYVFASPLGYGLNGNTHFTPYVPLQHLPHPMVSHSYVPAFQPVVHTNGINPEDYSLVPSLGVFRAAHPEANVGVFRAAHPEANVGVFRAAHPEANVGVFRAARPEANVGVFRAAHPEANILRMPSVIKQPLETYAKAEDGKTDKCDKDKSVAEEASFSLFHFGGPVALSTGFTSDPVSLKKEIDDDTYSKITSGQAEDDEACSKNTSIEEYNLFAASNGIKFSFL